MPLSDPATRRLLHQRDIELHGYEREDGLFDIEARLTDTKTYVINNWDRGDIAPGTPLHRMLARMTVDIDFVIQRFEAATEFAPYLACPDAAPNFAALAGISIGPGFMKTVSERVGGIKGCTHIRELLGQMGTVAFQTLGAIRARRTVASGGPRKRPTLLNTCLAYADGGAVARRSWPELYEQTPS